jgi:hypothetical protein
MLTNSTEHSSFPEDNRSANRVILLFMETWVWSRQASLFWAEKFSSQSQNLIIKIHFNIIHTSRLRFVSGLVLPDFRLQYFMHFPYLQNQLYAPPISSLIWSSHNNRHQPARFKNTAKLYNAATWTAEPRGETTVQNSHRSKVNNTVLVT